MIMEKADIALSDLTSAGGLAAADADSFIHELIDASVLMALCTVIKMKAPTQRIDRAKFGSRVLRSASSAQALTLNDRSKPDMARQELVAHEYKGEVRIPTDVLEDNIEGGKFRNTVFALLSERIALDMDEAILLSDTASSDMFLKKTDGMIKRASTHQVVAGGVPLSRTHGKELLKAMPQPGLRNKKLLRCLTSIDAEIDYRDSLIARETAGGEALNTSDAPVYIHGVPVVPVPMFPENLGVGTNETVTLLLNPKNTYVGIWRQITFDTDKDVTAGVWIVVPNIRFDVTYADPNLVVQGTGITVS